MREQMEHMLINIGEMVIAIRILILLQVKAEDIFVQNKPERGTSNGTYITG